MRKARTERPVLRLTELGGPGTKMMVIGPT